MRECVGRQLILLLTVTSSLAAADQRSVSASGTRDAGRYYTSGRWHCWQTENFQVCTLQAGRDLGELAGLCESLKPQLEAAWFGRATGERSWDPPCQVLVHATLRDYQRTLGNEVGDSVGCTTMQYDRGRVVTRRVDIRVDVDGWRQDALPHELTHVVIADLLGNRPLPPWLDEGIGMLSESAAMRGRRVAAYEAARERGFVYEGRDLVTLRGFPHPDYRDAFYAQSGALVQMLREHGGPVVFGRFARRSLDAGLDRALRETYQMAGIGELQERFQQSDTSLLVTRGGSLGEHATLMADADGD